MSHRARNTSTVSAHSDQMEHEQAFTYYLEGVGSGSELMRDNDFYLLQSLLRAVFLKTLFSYNTVSNAGLQDNHIPV